MAIFFFKALVGGLLVVGTIDTAATAIRGDVEDTQPAAQVVATN